MLTFNGIEKRTAKETATAKKGNLTKTVAKNQRTKTAAKIKYGRLKQSLRKLTLASSRYYEHLGHKTFCHCS